MEKYPRFYATSDASIIDEGSYIFIMAWTDNIINVAGHRLSKGAMEEAMAQHPDIADCAVGGKADPLKCQMPSGLFLINDGEGRAKVDLEGDLVQLVRAKIGAVAAFKYAAEDERLSETRSGKVLRGDSLENCGYRVL
jgi:propionyl-CoA synthetase